MLRRFLRNLGIALIILPEPFTTPVGILLLCISLCLPGQEHVDTYSHLQSFFTPYVSQVKASNQGLEARRKALTRVVHHILMYRRVYEPLSQRKLIHHTLRRDIPCEFRPAEPRKVIHHPLRRDLLYAYKMTEPERVTYHTLKRDLSYSRHDADSEKLISHVLRQDLTYEPKPDSLKKVMHHPLLVPAR